MVSMKRPCAVCVSMFSFRLTKATSISCSFATRESRSRVLRAKRLMLSTMSVSPSRRNAKQALRLGRSVSLPLWWSMNTLRTSSGIATSCRPVFCRMVETRM